MFAFTFFFKPLSLERLSFSCVLKCHRSIDQSSRAIPPNFLKLTKVLKVGLCLLISRNTNSGCIIAFSQLYAPYAALMFNSAGKAQLHRIVTHSQREAEESRGGTLSWPGGGVTNAVHLPLIISVIKYHCSVLPQALKR